MADAIFFLKFGGLQHVFECLSRLGLSRTWVPLPDPGGPKSMALMPVGVSSDGLVFGTATDGISGSDFKKCVNYFDIR